MKYLFYSFAVYLINSVLLTERGPFGTVDKLRSFLQSSHKEVKMAMDCPYCLSAYTSMIVIVLGVMGGDSPRKMPLGWVITWGAVWLLYEVRQLPSEIYVMALQIRQQPQKVEVVQKEFTVK